MSNKGFRFRVSNAAAGPRLIWERHDGTLALALDNPVCLETAPPDAFTVDGSRTAIQYQQIEAESGGIFAAVASIRLNDRNFMIRDRWHEIEPAVWRVDRTLEISGSEELLGVRVLLELAPCMPASGYGDFQYFAPPAIYNLNDLNEDGLEDYLESKALSYREDRLNLLSFLAFNTASRVGFALSRADPPKFDPVPDRERGQQSFLQRTAIGSLGIRANALRDNSLTLFAAYPFVERDRCNALYVKERKPWGAFWPVSGKEILTVSYQVHLFEADDLHDAFWQLWTQRFRQLAPKPVELAHSHAAIAAARLQSSMHYYVEEDSEPFAAGIVTNCHPQDGRQISNIIQYGFTGQNTLMAYNFMRAADAGNGEYRRRALRILDFFVRNVRASPAGLCHGLYNTDRRTFGDWWTGLLLPLAYAEPGGSLEELMGPLHDLLHNVIAALETMQGLYLRCAVEEYEPLLRVYEHEQATGIDHPEWLAACLKFGAFLIRVQEPDGSWMRAYDFDGKPITEPRDWFGQTGYQRKSSTATAIPFLLHLYRRDGDPRWLDAATRAGRFIREPFVERMRHNGGIHDSIYAKPQLVDGESIMFVARALLDLYRVTGAPDFLEGAVRAGRLVASWVCLWDVPLPPGSTLARHGFRSTGWLACDTPGAGYVHPMGMMAVPLLVELGLESGDDLFLQVAALTQHGSCETVSMPGRDWGYVMPGLQEEGALVSWWFADDPIFRDTAFGGRGKGEGNKTCLPWITAVGAGAHLDLMDRYGTADIAEIRKQGNAGRPSGVRS